MLHELLMVMATPAITESDIFRPFSDTDDEKYSTYKIVSHFDVLHPAERAQFDRLGKLAFQYALICEFCNDTLGNSHKSRLEDIKKGIRSAAIDVACCTILDIIREYENNIVECEKQIIHNDTEMVGGNHLVPISRILAIFTKWEVPFTSILELIQEIRQHINEKTFSAKWFMGYLRSRSRSGINDISNIMSKIYFSVEILFIKRVTSWIIHGVLMDVEDDGFLISREKKLDSKHIPDHISSLIASSILYTGRVHASVREATGLEAPGEMIDIHFNMMSNLTNRYRYKGEVMRTVELDKVITKIRSDVASWLWSKILTSTQLDECLRQFRNYFLFGKGNFGISLLNEIERLRERKAIARTPLSYKEAELNGLILNASMIENESDNGDDVANFKFKLVDVKCDEIILPSTALIGIPLKLTYELSWPMDLFLSLDDLDSYSALFTHLAVVRRAQLRVNAIWLNLSSMKRMRLRDISRNKIEEKENSMKNSVDNESMLETLIWSTTSFLIFFLNVIWSYYESDVIETAFNSLLKSTRQDYDDVDFEDILKAHAKYLRDLTRDIMDKKTLPEFYRIILTLVDRWQGLLIRVGATTIKITLQSLSEPVNEIQTYRIELLHSIKKLVQEWKEMEDNASGWRMRERLLLKLDYARWFSRDEDEIPSTMIVTNIKGDEMN